MAVREEDILRAVWCKKHGGTFIPGKTMYDSECKMPGEISVPNFIMVAYEEAHLGNPPTISEIKFFGKKPDAARWVKALKEILKEEDDPDKAVIISEKTGETERWYSEGGVLISTTGETEEEE
jgi:hypothetical protein